MSGVCAIVEPRKHLALKLVVENMRIGVPNWDIYVFHGTENEEWAKSELSHISRLFFFQLNLDNLSMAQYNQVLTSEVFYETFQTEYILIFQTDSLLIPENKHKIEDFLGYDYMGAVWDWKTKNRIGNGGLSLRRVSAMLRICRDFPFDVEAKINEDVYFSEQPSLKYPPEELASKFSVESKFYETPFGIHKPWVFFPLEEIRKICPAVDDLLDWQRMAD